MITFRNQANNVAEASFVIALNIARAKRWYGEGKFTKKEWEDVLKVLDQNNAALHKVVLPIPIWRRTTERRIIAINTSFEYNLKNYLENCIAFSSAFDESTDITDLPLLAVFIRFVSPDFVLKEELLDLVALQELTRGVDIKNALDFIMETFDVPLNTLSTGSRLFDVCSPEPLRNIMITFYEQYFYLNYFATSILTKILFIKSG